MTAVGRCLFKEVSSDIGTSSILLAFGYYRLSKEEATHGESSSITNQKLIVRNYCEKHGIVLVKEFVDDGYSGGNFDRPDFQRMIEQISGSGVNFVITKDLSRLGRNMRESSYYAEEFLPEHGVRYIAIGDNFDTEHDNVMAPFQFAMNEVYLRDGSRKVKAVLKHKREHGEYCACPPYGYKRDDADTTKLKPDEDTAPVVKRIFESAASGDSCRKIAMDLTADGIDPPLKHRALNGGRFSESGLDRIADAWSYMTVKRIIKNPVYLGHTILGKTKKVSVKSKKKIPVPMESWAITNNTHPPLISQEQFEQATLNLGRGRKEYMAYGQVRKSIFGGVAVCGKCGHALCSCGTVYKGEREKYWYLSCTHQRQDIISPCPGVRIKYTDLIEIVRTELNFFLSLTDDQMRDVVSSVIKKIDSEENIHAKEVEKERASARLQTIGRMITKLYADNAEGRLNDERLYSMVADLESEATSLSAKIEELSQESEAEKLADRFQQFFEIVQNNTHIDVLTREIVSAFIDKIEVFPKVLPPGKQIASHNVTYTQEVKIHYKFIGNFATSEIDSRKV